MSNYGTNIGKGNSFGDTTITNTTTIRKRNSHIAISITIGVIVIVAIIAFIGLRFSKISIVGTWITDDGERMEFLSDGTFYEGDYYDNLYADTYEIMDEGYLKIGKYDASWIQYRYTYWDIELSGNHLTLTMRDNPNNVINLTKE